MEGKHTAPAPEEAPGAQQGVRDCAVVREPVTPDGLARGTAAVRNSPFRSAGRLAAAMRTVTSVLGWTQWSTDPYFVDTVHDVVGLYLDPPERALVFCVDGKSQIQALDRSQPVLPMMPGVPERATHDYVRAGTTTLFAALEVATGKVIGSLHRGHRAEEFKKFLVKLDKEVPAGLDVHLICDNCATHKTPAIKKWLLAHPRFHLHFTPTGSSWLNLVERWFAELTNKQIRRGVHRSVQALEKDIRNWIAAWKTDPKPYVWTKTADEILERLATYLNRIPDSED
jgi:transposase